MNINYLHAETRLLFLYIVRLSFLCGGIKANKMTRTKKLYGFRLGESIPKWTDRFGRKGGKIIQLIRLEYCNKFQIQISNGDILTTEFMLQDDFHRRGLANEA